MSSYGIKIYNLFAKSKYWYQIFINYAIFSRSSITKEAIVITMKNNPNELPKKCQKCLGY